jgi:hypothetical protein
MAELRPSFRMRREEKYTGSASLDGSRLPQEQEIE